MSTAAVWLLFLAPEEKKKVARAEPSWGLALDEPLAFFARDRFEPIRLPIKRHSFVSMRPALPGEPSSIRAAEQALLILPIVSVASVGNVRFYGPSRRTSFNAGRVKVDLIAGQTRPNFRSPLRAAYEPDVNCFDLNIGRMMDRVFCVCLGAGLEPEGGASPALNAVAASVSSGVDSGKTYTCFPGRRQSHLK